MRQVLFRARAALARFALSATAGVALVVAVVPGTQAAAERRVALVIGNGAYQSVPTLDNPLTDSKAMAAALKRIGFEVVEGYDLKLDGMRSLVGEYAAKLDGAKVAFVYYAGHGVAVAGENYLLPTDTVLKNEADLDFRTMNINLVLRQMQREDRVNVVVLDACRDNPFAAAMKRAGAARSIGRGLARIEPEGSQLVAFAAKAGQTALDGTGGQGNSPFVASLVRHLAVPGTEIRKLFGLVRDDVLARTGRAQEPAIYGSLGGADYYFLPPASR